MTERRLILIKHAMPQIEPDRTSSLWTLSEAGRASCEPLADALFPYELSVIVSSTEPKARETAGILGDRLSVSVETMAGLHEHDRAGVPFLDDPIQWDMAINRFFAEPGVLVLGRETATAAHDRFSAALTRVLAHHDAGNLAVVTHGTVMSLCIAQHTGVDAMTVWRALDLPSFVVVRLPSFLIERTVDTLPEVTQGDRPGTGGSERQEELK